MSIRIIAYYTKGLRPKDPQIIEAHKRLVFNAVQKLNPLVTKVLIRGGVHPGTGRPGSKYYNPKDPNHLTISTKTSEQEKTKTHETLHVYVKGPGSTEFDHASQSGSAKPDNTKVNGKEVWPEAVDVPEEIFYADPPNNHPAPPSGSHGGHGGSSGGHTVKP